MYGLCLEKYDLENYVLLETREVDTQKLEAEVSFVFIWSTFGRPVYQVCATCGGMLARKDNSYRDTLVAYRADGS
jgi:hypothetical protein